VESGKRRDQWSREHFRILGVDPDREKPSLALFWSRVHPEDRALLEKAIDQAAQQKTNFTEEYRIVVPDGIVKHVHGIGRAVLDDSGELVEFIGTMMDITERKQAEDALKRSEAYLSEGQRLSHTGSLARSVSTGEVYCSQESYRIFGLDPATKVTLEMQLSRMHPDDRSSIAETVQKANRDASDFEDDYRIIREDGSIRHIHVLGHPVKNAAGNVVEFVGTHMDVTEQHLSRKALEDALVEINSLKEQLFQENVALRQEIEETSMFEEIVGRSSALQKILKQLETVSPTDSTVLICGETGTGKELIARAIHNLSARRSNAFVKVNCAAIPTGLLESELFGHEKGAFTGAISQRIAYGC